MTGFGRAAGSCELPDGAALQWSWELKSVNGRSLDLRFRLPSGLDGLEPTLRKRAADLGRGNVSAQLSVEAAGSIRGPSIDEDVLARVTEALSAIRLRIECEPPRADGILNVKGLLKTEDRALDAEVLSGAHQPITDGFDLALAALVVARTEEGLAMGKALVTLIDQMADLVAVAEAEMPHTLARHREALRRQITDLCQDQAIDPDRLAQEASLLAIKSDIREEVDRLKAHFEQARALLDQGGVVGRKLDFLAQELAREANTLTTKSHGIGGKRLGLDLRALVDQFKEQVQNIA